LIQASRKVKALSFHHLCDRALCVQFLALADLRVPLRSSYGVDLVGVLKCRETDLVKSGSDFLSQSSVKLSVLGCIPHICMLYE
jgi:hypothetical protein